MAIIQNLALKNIPNVDQLLQHELTRLWKIYQLLDQARSDFLKGLLTVDEYLDILNDSGVNVDQYLFCVHQNLTKTLGYDFTT